MGKDDMVKAAGYGLGGVSGLATSGEMAVSNINGLLQFVGWASPTKMSIDYLLFEVKFPEITWLNNSLAHGTYK